MGNSCSTEENRGEVDFSLKLPEPEKKAPVQTALPVEKPV
jgi:hypothetical protein